MKWSDSPNILLGRCLRQHFAEVALVFMTFGLKILDSAWFAAANRALRRLQAILNPDFHSKIFRNGHADTLCPGGLAEWRS